MFIHCDHCGLLMDFEDHEEDCPEAVSAPPEVGSSEEAQPSDVVEPATKKSKPTPMSTEPPSHVRQAVQTFLEPNAECVPGYKLLKQHGRWWYNDGSVNESIGHVKECFFNVYSCSFLGRSYGTAAYGLAVADDIPLALPHAWRVVTDTDTICELTPSWNMLVSEELFVIGKRKA